MEIRWKIAGLYGAYPVFIEFGLKNSMKMEKEDVKKEVVETIKKVIPTEPPHISCNFLGGERYNVFSSPSVRIPYSNYVSEKKKKFFAFVLLEEQRLVGGMDFTEAIYAVKILHDAVKVLCLDFGRGSSFPKKGSSHYRFLTGKLSGGVLTYTKKERYDYDWGKGVSDNEEKVDLLQKFTTKS